MISSARNGVDEGPRRRARGLRLYLLALVGAVLVPALAGGIATTWQLSEAQREQVEESLRTSASAMAVALDRELEALLASAAGLASWPALRRNAAIDSEMMADFYAHAASVAARYDGWVSVARADGGRLLDTRQRLGSDLPPVAGRLWIDQVLTSGRPAISDIFLPNSGEQPHLTIFAPVQRNGDRSAGDRNDGLVVMLAFNSVHLADAMIGMRPGEISGLVHALEGRLIARSVGRAAVGQSVPLWAATAVASAESGLVHGTASDGRELTTAFQRLERLPWAAVVGIPYERYVAAWRAPLTRLSLGGLALLLAGLILALIVSRRLLQPIGSLAAEAEALAAGGPAPQLHTPVGVAEFEALRLGLHRSAELIRSRAVAEGRVQAAEAVAQALRAERDRARLYFDVAGVVLLVLGPDGRVQGINRRGLEVLGLRHENEAIGRDWVSEFLPLAARPATRLMFERIATGGVDMLPTVHETSVLRADGEQRLITWHNATLRDADGRLTVIVASGEDVTDSRAAEERQVMLMREVDHRAKNALAVVQSILRMTETPDPADFAATVEGRVSALARAHTLLASENWTGSDLRLLIEAELAGYVGEGRVSIGGPRVWLSPEAVQAASMVAHELTTNAIRHGALADPGGRVSVHWEATPQQGLQVVWTEHAAPGRPVARPVRRGFGLRMVDATVRSQFRGRITYDWQPDGLQCTMTIAAERLSLRGPINAQPALPQPAARPALPPAVRRILLAEDEPLVAMELEAQLRGMGFTVTGPAATLQQAMDLAASDGELLAAVLDVNLAGQAVFPVADLLVRRGVPVVFATGYGSLPGGWATSGGQGRTALLRKPLSRGALAAALRELTGLPESGSDEAGGTAMLRLQERA
ncbi:HWE histidine kinase domain-containing protein [Teichococcus oryzae]|uniref:histidine kinase n=1 Tax=Teichococcus oryzae TaxID=1608942 RepID=A0A5B2TJP2_9PROT|nr:HWE histidine kinase domain-containing protein [Pseudoroseomonas oryzae]KAA2214323.1 PAS domain S-box protein [Pseudoroseomonas oryzae]